MERRGKIVGVSKPQVKMALFGKPRALFSATFWKQVFSTLPTLTIRVRYDGRERIERLADEFSRLVVGADGAEKPLTTMLAKLRRDDYLVVKGQSKQREFVQYINAGYLRFELPLPKGAEFSGRKRRSMRILSKLRLRRGPELFGIHWKPVSYYELLPWKDGGGTVKGEILVINFRKNYAQAALVGILFLKAIDGWDGTEKLDFLLGTFNRSWWGRL